MAKVNRILRLEAHAFARNGRECIVPLLVEAATRTIGKEGAELEAIQAANQAALMPSTRYAKGVVDRTLNVFAVIEQADLARRLMGLSPPKAAKAARLDHASWTDYHLATFTHSVVSAFDASLLLIAEVFEMGIAPKHCRLDLIRSHAFLRGTKIPAILKSFNDGLQPYRARRNRSLHHGERPTLEALLGPDAPLDLRLVTLLAASEPNPDRRVVVRIGWRVAILQANPKLDAVENVVYENVEALMDQLDQPFTRRLERWKATDPVKP